MKNCIHISIFCTDKANFFCIIFTQSMFQTIRAMLYIIYLAVLFNSARIPALRYKICTVLHEKPEIIF